ncbi:glycosyltransferase family 2 protein [bacterium]|nr:glycosyltransferase family 2 protein [bacterium]
MQALYYTIAILSTTALLAAYVLYPLAMALLAKYRNRPWRVDEETLPAVTMVVAVYNEEKVLEEKLRNFRELDYPKDKLFLLFGSDGSNDSSHEILAREEDERVSWHAFERGGKLRTINRLMQFVHTPIVVYSDANTMYRKDSIRKLVRHFVDEEVGAVCGNLHLQTPTESVGGKGERTYWTYENYIKHWEAQYQTALGATGGIYAIRSSLFHEQPEHAQVADDLLLPLRITADNRRVLYESEAVATEATSPTMHDEFRRKVRIARTSFNCLPPLMRVFNRYPARVKWMIVFHKFLRWMAPFFFLLLALSIVLLAGENWIRLTLFYPLLAFLALGILGWIVDLAGKRMGPLSLPFYFLAINAAFLVAWLTLPFHRGQATWEPTKR